ncbi:hypothetical protein G9A89_013038 [Geosiphon pyriformis]|nr:hypothetical protein G9A89_013038 [Geosiphon pyriformis]
MSGFSAKRRFARVSTTGSVGGGSTQKIKNLKDDGPVSVDGQFASMVIDGKASDGRAASDSQMNTPNMKCFNTGAAIGSPIGSINYDIDDEKEGSLPPHLSFSLEKVWVDFKIVKSQVKVAVKKLFALDINLSDVERKLATAKTQVIRKLFLTINGFGRATTFSKFKEIIRLTFTSSKSIEKTTLLARKNNIIAIVIKKIPINMPKEMIVAVVSEFGEIKLIKIQLIGLWQKAVAVSLANKWSFLIGKDSVCVAMAVSDRETWASRDQFRVLLFTLLMGTTAHNLGDLLERAGEKTCVINWLLETDNRVHCAVVCFDSDEARLNLVCCEWCGKFGYSALECDAEVVSALKSLKFFIRLANLDTRLQLAKLYAKKNVPISCPVAFGGKFWAQVVSVALVSHGFRAGSGFSSSSSGALSLGGAPPLLPVVNSPLSARLVLLERSVELLSEQISNILSRLDNIGLALLVSSSQMALSVVVSQFPISVLLVVVNSDLDFNMAVDDLFVQPTFFSLGVTDLLLGLSSSKVLTSKVGGLESKLVAFDIFVGSILAKLDQLCADSGSSEDIFHWHKESGSLISIIMKRFEDVQVFMSGLDVGFCGAGVVIFVNNSLARHVSKVEEMKGRVFSICLLFKNKLSVSIIGLYACASGGDRFAQASVINLFIADTVNKSSFVVLGGDFNKDNSVKGVSLRKCLGLGLVNVFGGHSLARISTWSNSRSVSKILDYILISDSLISAVVNCDVSSVLEFFDMDYLAVSMSIGLGGLLDAHLNSIHKYANKDCWKFKIKNADEKKWVHFKKLSECALLDSLNRFKTAENGGNLDEMWGVLAEAMTASAEKNFSRYWYNEFDCTKNRLSFKFSRLELLVTKLLKVLRLDDMLGFNCLANTWFKVDPSEAFKVLGMVRDSVDSAGLISHLSKVRKQYRKSKYYESEVAKRSAIRDAIDKRMEKFDTNKSGMIRSILEQPFCKVVLDHLVVGNSLILEPNKVKLKVDDIMVNWTRKQNALPVLSGPWAQQYAPLAYVNDDAFSLVMCDITMCEMSLVISNLPDDKAADFCLVLECLLSLLNSYLHFGNVLPYNWNGILSNTQPIALIKMAKKILSKVLSDRISLACSKFNVLCGNNFSIFKSTSTQSPISAVGSIVENALEKSHELWLVLQDMHKAYDSVGWPHLEASLCHIKMCGKFIKFFGNIYNNRFNRVMTDFGLSDGYKVLDSLNQSETGRIKTSEGITSFFATGVFVDDTIWVGNGQASIQHIFNVANEFFLINDININSKKTVAIPINKKMGVPVLSINGQTITVANPGPSLAKANSDIRFFSNMVLWKAVSDKQFSYLVSAVLQLIVSYRTQFSFDILIRKSLKSKANLPRDFPNEALHHPFLYGLKSFEQLQAECKIAFILRVNTSNNFLVGMVCIFLDNKLSLDNKLPCAFCSLGCFSMSLVLDNPLYFNVVCSLKIAGVAYGNQLLDKNGSVVSWHTFRQWKRLGSRGPMSLWFLKASTHLNSCLHTSPPVGLASVCASVLDSTSFADIHEEIHGLWADKIDVYTDSSLRGLGTFQVACGAAVYFPSLNKDLGVEVHGVLSSILAELQAVALALECVPASVSVALHTDSQVAIDACVAELGLLQPDFKDHAGITGNVMADVFAEQTAHSRVSLPIRINCRYVVADGRPVSGNACHFEVSPGQGVLSCLFGLVVDWNSTTLVWHSNSHMLSGSMCRASAALCMYFMKAVHFKLSVAVQKRLYNKDYFGVLCLFCGDVELPDHGFICVKDASVWSDILGNFGVSDVGLYSVFCKGFVLKSWMDEAIASLGDKKKAAIVVIDFVCCLAESYRMNLWLFRTKFRSDIERSGLIGDDIVVASALGVGVLPFLVGTVHLTGVLDSLDVGFGFKDRFLFLSGAVHRVSVSISV